jgi:agmatine deiminase
LDSTDYLNVTPDSFIPSQAPAEGDSLVRVGASSYLNYLVSNGVVLLPTYRGLDRDAGKEKRVEAIMKKAFPGRKLVWINCMPQNWSGGGIHCSTQQQPVRVRN